MVGRLNPNWIVPTAPRGTSDNRTASTAFVTGGGAGPRIVLPSLTYPSNTFWYASTGNDSTGTGTSANPFLTPQGAMNVLAALFDFANQDVMIKATAAFTSNSGLRIIPWTGAGTLKLDANSGSLSYTGSRILDGTILSDLGALPGTFTFQNVTLTNVRGTGNSVDNFAAYQPGSFHIGPGVIFSTTSRNQMICNQGGANLNWDNNFTVSGSSTRVAALISLATGGSVFSVTGITLSFSAAVTYARFVQAQFGGLAVIPNGSTAYQNTGGGAPTNFTGNQGSADSAGGILTGNNGNTLPGTAATFTITPPGYGN